MSQSTLLDFCTSLAIMLIAGNVLVFYVCVEHAQEQFGNYHVVDATSFIVTAFSSFIGCIMLVFLHHAKKHLQTP